MAMRPMMLVDLAVIAPFFVELVFAGALDLRFLRALRLFRLFRLLRFGRLANALGMIGRVIRAKRAELAITIAVVGVAVLLAAGAIYMIEREVDGSKFTSILRRARPAQRRRGSGARLPALR